MSGVTSSQQNNFGHHSHLLDQIIDPDTSIPTVIPLKRVSKVLTSDQLLHLFSAPVEFLPSPGPGKFYVPARVLVKHLVGSRRNAGATHLTAGQLSPQVLISGSAQDTLSSPTMVIDQGLAGDITDQPLVVSGDVDDADYGVITAFELTDGQHLAPGDVLTDGTNGAVVVVDTIDNAWPIIGVNVGAKTITIAGNHTAQFTTPGQTIHIYRSTGNDGSNGSYTLVSSSFAGGNTTIHIAETLASSVADGWIGNETNGPIGGAATYHITNAGHGYQVGIGASVGNVVEWPGGGGATVTPSAVLPGDGTAIVTVEYTVETWES